MRTFKPVVLKIFTVAAFFWICSCNYTQTYTPEFNGKQVAVLDSINSKYSFENIEIQGKITSGTGGTHNILIIRLINGKNLPTDTGKMVVLAQHLAHQVKSIIKNPKAIGSYSLYFDTKTVDGINTTTQSTEMEFKPGDI